MQPNLSDGGGLEAISDPAIDAEFSMSRIERSAAVIGPDRHQMLADFRMATIRIRKSGMKFREIRIVIRHSPDLIGYHNIFGQWTFFSDYDRNYHDMDETPQDVLAQCHAALPAALRQLAKQADRAANASPCDGTIRHAIESISIGNSGPDARREGPDDGR